MKPIYLLTAILLSIGACAGMTIQTDTIYGIYNNTCIETANFQYITIDNPTNLSLHEGQFILLINLNQTGPKSAHATIIPKID